MSITCFPSSSFAPPGRNSAASSRNVTAIRRERTSSRRMPCFHSYLAGPDTTIRHRCGMATETVGQSSRVSVRAESERRLIVTRRSPQNQKSSKCGSMADPRSGTYSRWQSSTGRKSARSGRERILATSERVKDGSPTKVGNLIFRFLKLTFGP